MKEQLWDIEINEKSVARELRLRQAFAYIRKPIIRFFYNKLAKRTSHENLNFLNYGFDFTERLPELSFEDDAEKYSLALYYQLVAGIDLAGKDIVEVGSGRGGGASFLSEHFKPRSMIGVDISPEAVALANLNHGNEILDFKVGDAERLPIPSQSADVVVNVESSHCYGSLTAFLNEVARSLRPGGVFAYTDFRYQKTLPHLAYALKFSSLDVVSFEDITPLVVSALEKDSDRRLSLIKKHVKSQREQNGIANFAGIKDTHMYNSFAKGKRIYFRMMLRKAAGH